MNAESEFDLLKRYLDIYIQLLPYSIKCKGMRLKPPQMPTFEYFKSTLDDDSYSLETPFNKEVKDICGNEIVPVHTHGIGTENGIGYRFYNYWLGCKYFTGGNIQGDYTIETSAVNIAIKKCK